MCIDVCRRAIKAIYAHVGKTAPVWLDDDDDPGIDEEECLAQSVAMRSDADPNDPNTIRLAYAYKDSEHVCSYYPPGSA
jgi:hypothetical protein